MNATQFFQILDTYTDVKARRVLELVTGNATDGTQAELELAELALKNALTQVQFSA